MVDLNMPDGLSDDERVQWLRETGEALRRETGRSSGVTEHQPGKDGQSVWGIWWSDDG
ncbi:hypothetical protein [Kutzneria chonburiensis]|uniref:Uncharacterized protein n=1 Tax=Kutzneria chonburiensis TaxID=1483604 RepID=A0ABV6MUZ4_9PSEU|nr:hypothetical protein [Kutzneria chonburiensis]